MVKLTKIDINPKIKCNKQIKDYLNPDYIYMPYFKDYNLNVNNNSKVTKDDILLQKGDNYIYSPVSGTVMGLTDMIVDKKQMKTIVIENDFREAQKLKGVKKDISSYTKEELINLVKKLKAFNGNLNGETLIISGIDYEPYEETKSYLIHAHTDEILECTSSLIKILGIHKCFFAILNNDSENVITLMNQIGTYPEIDLKLMPDLYPIGNKEVLIEKLVSNSKKADGVVFLTVEDVYNIYHILKRNKPVSEKLVTFSGDLLSKSKVINAKIGTRIEDILQSEFKILGNDFHIIINGLLSGYEINTTNAIITHDIRSVFINKVNNEPKNKCINCGLCFNSCPVGCNPKRNINMDKCIKCGLCNYVCPSKINLLGGKNE